MTQYQATHDTYFDLTCSPILAASHFNTARIENGDGPFFSKFASELCAGTRTCVGKTLLCSEMYFQTPRLKCKELLQWRHSDLKGAMETPVTGWGGPVMLTCLCLQRLTIC